MQPSPQCSFTNFSSPQFDFAISLARSYSIPLPSKHQSTLCLFLFAFFGNFVEHGIMQYVVFHVWLLSLNIVLLRVICVVVCIRGLFLFIKSSNFAVFSFVNVPHFVYLFSWESFGLFPVWDCYEEHCCELLHIRICVDLSYHFF